MINIDKDLSLIIHQTLQAVLSPDKTLIDQAQQQLKVLEVRQGKLKPILLYLKVGTNFLKIHLMIWFQKRILAGLGQHFDWPIGRFWHQTTRRRSIQTVRRDPLEPELGKVPRPRNRRQHKDSSQRAFAVGPQRRE